ncbi:hypothetical protein ACMYSQ_008669 [Aspergillus niger]
MRNPGKKGSCSRDPECSSPPSSASISSIVYPDNLLCSGHPSEPHPTQPRRSFVPNIASQQLVFVFAQNVALGQACQGSLPPLASQSDPLKNSTIDPIMAAWSLLSLRLLLLSVWLYSST